MSVTDTPPCSALVLAGGASRRFGSDKLNATIAGRTLLEHALASVRALTPDVILVGREHPGVTWFVEPAVGSGPLNAICHGLERTRHEAVIVIAGDQPAVAPRLLAFLVTELGGADAVVALDHSDRPQPLLAVYRRGLADAMGNAVAAGERSISRFLETVDTHWVTPESWEPLDPAGRSFHDVDTPDDLARHRGDRSGSASGNGSPG